MPYIQEYKFDDCKNVKPLPFDFVVFKNQDLKDIDFCIEIQGQQHYKPVNFGGISDREAQESLDGCRKRDKIKYNYCKDNNIKLIEIPYWDFENIINIIEEVLNK